jgi:hypothetical protein
MKGVRAPTLVWVIVASVLAACMPMEEQRYTADVERELERGRQFAAWVTSPRLEPSDADAIAAGYLERLRLGLGSPFRLIEYALQDPRLERAERDRIGWALLAATADGRGYRVDPRAVSPTGDMASAVRHLELIEGAILESPDPDGGVLALRLAYAMAEAEGSVPLRLPARVAQAAALIRDRAVSREDARRLLRAAGSETDPLTLVMVWRVDRQFRVEAPAVMTLGTVMEREASALAPRLLEGIRSIADRPRAGPLIPAPEMRQQPLLSPAAAARLSALADAQDYPPQTPVVVALASFRGTGGTAAAAAREEFFDRAVDEERLAARYALLYHGGALDAGTRLSVLGAAASLRAYAQERPWFPGFEGPARRDLEDRFGIAAIEFPDSIPVHWRPYYRRMLESALSDLERVLPTLEVRGLRIRIQAREGSPGTLAVHDPRSRTMYLPPATGAGTIAHEVAHDLDWQTALRRYNVRGDYATDRAVREQDGRLARVMLGLTAASIAPSALNHPEHSHANRPAEVFARSVDWFSAVALAREGRINGYLSSVQDDLLTGYGTVTPPDVTGAAGQALIALLDEVAPVYSETRRWFLRSYGQFRQPTAFDLARRILEAPLDGDGVPEVLSVDWRGHDPGADEGAAARELPRSALLELARVDGRLERLELVRDSILGALMGTCGLEGRAIAPRRQLVLEVTGARARGLALEAAREVAGLEGRRWMEAQLRGRNDGSDLEEPVLEALRPLVARVQATTEIRPAPTPYLSARSQASECSFLPY